MNIAQCTDCQEPTKTPVGFWDGRDKNGTPTSGFLYDCSNADCPIKQEEMKAELEAEQKVLKTQEENRQNGVDIQEMIRARREARMSMMACAKALGIAPYIYSNYEHEREPISPEEWKKIIETAKEATTHEKTDL